MPKAIWNGVVVAESESTQQIEGNHYFPPESVKTEFLTKSDTTTVCPWKGTASYYNIEIDGKVARDAVWVYPEPKEAAKQIKDYLAFWRGVEIIE